jgi:hypothetical protein
MMFVAGNQSAYERLGRSSTLFPIGERNDRGNGPDDLSWFKPARVRSIQKHLILLKKSGSIFLE